MYCNLERLRREHSRGRFRSGQADVDQWLATKARQHQEEHLSVTKVVVDDRGAIAGDYTLATGQAGFQTSRGDDGEAEDLKEIQLGLDTRHNPRKLVSGRRWPEREREQFRSPGHDHCRTCRRAVHPQDHDSGLLYRFGKKELAARRRWLLLSTCPLW
jgi:hypothetical protein